MNTATNSSESTTITGVTAKITMSGATTVFNPPMPTPCSQSQKLFMSWEDSSMARTPSTADSQ